MTTNQEPTPSMEQKFDDLRAAALTILYGAEPHESVEGFSTLANWRIRNLAATLALEGKEPR